MSVIVQFIDCQRDELSEYFGPFDYVQLVSTSLRIGPDDDDLAYYDEEKEAWIFEGKEWSDISIG